MTGSQRLADDFATGVVARPRYQVPAPYRQIQYGGLPPVLGTGFDLTPGMNGLKVQLVADRLGLDQGGHQSMSGELATLVSRFQAGCGLAPTGVVDLATWEALGFDGAEWTALDGYQWPLRVNPTMSREEIVEAFVATALAYVGRRYIWGGANRPDQGADCSGLVIQALYSIGIDPTPIDPVKHALPEFRSSRELYALPGFLHVPVKVATDLGWRAINASVVARGDIVFYAIRGGLIDHVAIALGDGEIVEEVPSGGRIRGLTDPPGLQPEAVRPLP